MKNKWIVPAIIVALGLFLLGQRIESGIVKSKEAVRTVSVKGLSEREVPADRVIWPLVYKELGNDLSSIYRAVNAKNKIVIDFLKWQRLEFDIPGGECQEQNSNRLLEIEWYCRERNFGGSSQHCRYAGRPVQQPQ